MSLPWTPSAAAGVLKGRATWWRTFIVAVESRAQDSAWRGTTEIIAQERMSDGELTLGQPSEYVHLMGVKRRSVWIWEAAASGYPSSSRKRDI